MANATDGRQQVDVTGNKTLVAADSGIVQNVIADGAVITLPATVVGLEYIIKNGGARINATGPVGALTDGGVGLNVTPQAADGFTGNGFTAAAAKGAVNAKATSNIGDEIRVSGTGVAGAAAWVVGGVRGLWTRQP
jgi:hypothetical protein